MSNRQDFDEMEIRSLLVIHLYNTHKSRFKERQSHSSMFICCPFDLTWDRDLSTYSSLSTNKIIHIPIYIYLDWSLYSPMYRITCTHISGSSSQWGHRCLSKSQMGLEPKTYGKKLFSFVPKDLFTDYDVDPVHFMFYSDLIEYPSLSFLHEKKKKISCLVKVVVLPYNIKWVFCRKLGMTIFVYLTT